MQAQRRERQPGIGSDGASASLKPLPHMRLEAEQLPLRMVTPQYWPLLRNRARYFAFLLPCRCFFLGHIRLINTTITAAISNRSTGSVSIDVSLLTVARFSFPLP
jgi:hypothetical protein